MGVRVFVLNIDMLLLFVIASLQRATALCTIYDSSYWQRPKDAV